MPYIWDQDKRQYMRSDNGHPMPAMTPAEIAETKSDRAVATGNRLGTWITLHKAASVAIAVGIVIVLTIVVSVIGAHQASQSGYRNMTTLQQSITQQTNKKMVGTGETVTQALCVPTGANTATCNLQGSLGDSTTQYVSIAPDGNSWVSHP